MQKFIVTSDGRLKFGDVTMHKDLLEAGESCIGGGVYEFDYSSNSMLLSGKSYDFGRVMWSFIEEITVPATLEGMELVYEGIPLSYFVNIKVAK